VADGGGFKVSDFFVVDYGLDYFGRYRNLPLRRRAVTAH
jgi:hypoxanthine-guanine phosphoribosyltransferase